MTLLQATLVVNLMTMSLAAGLLLFNRRLLRKIREERAELARDLAEGPFRMMTAFNKLLAGDVNGARMAGLEMIDGNTGKVVASAGEVPKIELKPGKGGWQ